ncbi:MAG: DUF1934 domain-containing protein [Clostridia bacterium]|nr:DUF1934 domain-containing protein [Clostridia bacterium]MDH7571975.1 DUF1934 domain-containing protein [Clostridia bacterium]
MYRPILVRVRGTQVKGPGEEDNIELVTEGRLYRRDCSYYILYQETCLSGLEGTLTSLKIEPTRVVLNRMGGTAQRQSFEEGVWHQSYYVTPYGAIRVGVIPSRVDVDLTERGGSINLEYELQIDQEKVSDNRLSITVWGLETGT